MNLKLNADVAGSARILHRKTSLAIKEERRRTGRYIAILVGICLFLLAIYHAWVRRIPVVASLVVPALIMFIYVAWVLFTASRDKHRLLDLEAARAMTSSGPSDVQVSCPSRSISRQDSQTSQDDSKDRCIPTEVANRVELEQVKLVRPIILINDKPPEDLELRISNLIETMLNDKCREHPTRRRFKRRFCRSKRHAVYKRSYSIA